METLKPHHGDDYQADRRMRELYRYFRPTSHPDLNSPCVPADDALPAGVNGSNVPVADATGATPITTALAPDTLILGDPNKTLNSFAQLGALRLNAEHALISVSDAESQFILAEATQAPGINRSIKRAGREESDWPGRSVVDTAWSVCEATIELPPSGSDTSQCSMLIVNNLSKDERFKRLPFVQGKPHFRFYAGTPLTTDSGINIGCLFVLDKQPRAGLTDGQRETMGSLAALVVDYLKISRQADEGHRATRLSHGLSYFVEGSSSFVDNLKSPCPSSLALPGIPSPGNPRSRLSTGSCNSSTEVTSRRSISSDLRSIGSLPECEASPYTPLPDWWPGKGGPPVEGSHGTTWTFRRAANILRESLDLGNDGGVIFLEAGNSLLFDIGDNLTDAGDPASVLAISTSEEPFAPRSGSPALYPAANLGMGFLHQLLRRYSKGKLWSFHRDGMIASSDEDAKSRNNHSRATKPIGTSSTNRGWRTMENAMLNRYFPSTSQVLFVPLWNAANSLYFGGCFCWTTAETRVFSSAVELSSVLAFGTSIMAECSRLESQIADRQKGDFIGSTSHELRSPLHGILAAVELLSSTRLNEFQESLLETVNACGRTLLDTMNQVLDFSKIVSMERERRHNKRLRGSLQDSTQLDRLPHLDSSSPFDLAILTEEVVEGIYAGHAYGQRKPTSCERAPSQSSARRNDPAKVKVDIDIARSDWVFRAQPGVLRRIIMNVFGNAMKYTDTGRILIHLSKAERADSRGEDLVTLIVSDTGKGMSEEFLSERLYTPFTQEDSLASGTGLGLSIVRSLVKSLNGNMRVYSRPGYGTTVKISLPLTRANEVSSLPRMGETELIGSGKYARAAILGVDPEATESWGVIAQYLTDWYGLELVSWPSPVPIDVLLADERELAVMPKSGLYRLPALLIFCSQPVRYDEMRTEWTSHVSLVDIIHQPCGPYKLGRSISRALSSQHRIPPLRTTDLPERTRSDTLGSLEDTSFSKEERHSRSIDGCHKFVDPKGATKPRILVVDDNAINLNLMLTFLKRRNLETLASADNGAAAVQAVEQAQQGYDIIFMDVSMPVMNGFEATRAIRALEKDRALGARGAMIVALTGLSSPQDQSEALASGFDLFLMKPVSFKEVARLLGEWQGRSCCLNNV